MSSPSAFERRAGVEGPTGPTGPAGPSGPTGPPSPAVTLSGNTTGTLTLVSTGTLTLAGGNNITLSQSGNAVTISGASQSIQAETQTFIGGISASDTLYTSGTVKLTGVGGGVTVSSNTGQRVDISVAAPVAQTNQAGSVYAISNTSGTSSGTYDARTMSIAGAGLVTVAASNSGFRIDATSAAQTNQSGNLYASSNTFGTSSGTYDARTLSIAGSGAVSVAASNSGWVISAPAAVAQTNQAGSVYAASNTSGTSSGTYDARTLSIAGAGLVTVAASNSGWRIGADQTNQAGSVYAGSNTSGTSSGTYDARTLSIVGAGLVTVAASNSGWRIDATSAAQTNQSGNVYAASNTFGTSSGTADARTLSIAGDGIISVAASNSGWRISATQSVQTQNIMQVTASGNRTSGGGGYVVISSGTMALAGGPNITLSQDANTISISAGAFSAGMSTEGNTAGNTGVTGSRLIFVGSNNISLSQTTGAAGATLSFNGPASSSLSATGQVQISTNVSTISIGVPNAAVSYYDQADLLQYGATQGIGASAATQTTVTAWVQPASFARDLVFNNAGLAASISMSTNSTSISSQNWSYSMGASLGFYTLNVSTLSLVTSFSGSLGYTNASAAAAGNLSATARVGMGGSSTTKSTQGAANLSAIFSSITGARIIPMMWTTQAASLTRGQYWAVACLTELTSSIANASITSMGFVSNRTAMGSAFAPPSMMQNTASVTSPYPFLGLATLVNSSNSLMPVSFNTSKVTTATAIANSTNFQSFWMQLHSSHSN